MLNAAPYDISVLSALNIYDTILPCTRNIFHDVLIPMGCDHIEVFPSIETIAYKSGYGTTQVKTALKEAVAVGVLEIYKKPGMRSNHYKIKKTFVDICVSIKACHFRHSWKKHRLELFQQVSEDSLFFAKLLDKRGQLSTTKLSSCYLSKVSTIELLLSLKNPVVFIDRKEEPAAVREQAVNSGSEIPNPIKAGSPYLWGLKIKEKDLRTLTFRNSPEELKIAREKFDFLKHKKGVRPYNDAALLITLLKKRRAL